MPVKENLADRSALDGQLVQNVRQIERFLRLLTWQMFFLLAILLYMVMRPQPGRYQFTVAGEDAGVFDTAYGRAHLVKLQKQVVKQGETPSADTSAAGASPSSEGNAGQK
jgi:hypothetical protein